jgi:hypothetical protein
MKNDSISASSKIKELINLHKLGELSDEEYLNLLKSQIISQWKVPPLKELKTEKNPVKDSKEDNCGLSGEFKKSGYDLLKSEIVCQREIQPTKEKVEKILWVLLN